MPREEYVRVQERSYPHPPTPATPVFALGQPRVCAEQTGKEEQSPLWQAGDGQLESNGGRRIEAFFCCGGKRGLQAGSQKPLTSP